MHGPYRDTQMYMHRHTHTYYTYTTHTEAIVYYCVTHTDIHLYIHTYLGNEAPTVCGLTPIAV